VVIVIAVNFAFVQFLVPLMNTAHLAEPRFGATTIESVRGVWAIIVALFLSILFLAFANRARFESVKASLNHGADAACLPIFNVASLVGFGAVIAALPAFDMISEAVLSLGAGNPLISLAAAVNVLSALTGSASGGMSIALDALGATYVQMAYDYGYSLDAMHRVTAVASGALDALPHNGAVITILSICKLSHREAYIDVFMVASRRADDFTGRTHFFGHLVWRLLAPHGAGRTTRAAGKSSFCGSGCRCYMKYKPGFLSLLRL
jgi:H+/gluconate symporter-like permease